MNAVNPVRQPVSVDYWEQVGTTTRWGRYLAGREESVILRGLKLAGTPGPAVDIGCGGGRWSKVLADAGWTMTCIEVDENALLACRQKLPLATCVRVLPTDERIPCPSGSQRLMLCMEAPDVIEKRWFAAETHRVLDRGGHVIGFYMNPNSWRGLTWTDNGKGCIHYRGVAYCDWRRDFLANGFEMLHEESFSWMPFRRISDSRLIPPAATLERWLGLRRLVRFAPWILFVARKKKEDGGG